MVAIGGISGAGKTVVVEKVAEVLGDAVTFHYDNYPHETPSDTYRWLREGLDLNLIRTPQFTEDLRSLKNSRPVTPPSSGEVVEPARFIVVEEPFSRARKEVSGLIDLAVYIDVPFEIALARKWIREFPAYADHLQEKAEFNHDSFIGFIYGEMFLYLLNRRDEYISWHNQALRNCDLVLDGMKSVDVLAKEIVVAVGRRSGVTVGDTERRHTMALTADSSVADILKSHPHAKDTIARHVGMSVDESQLAMAMHMTLRQVARFLGLDQDKVDALLRDVNQG